MHVLILGGTAEARALARALVEQGVFVTSTLAGRVAHPALPAGEVRIGGFGGVAGLVSYVQAGGFTQVVDATHPFAAQMSRHASLAAAETEVPLLRLARPGWRAHPLAKQWTWVDSLHAARSAADGARRPFVTTGRQSLPAYAAWSDRDVLVRLVDVAEGLPARWTSVISRGPYDHDGERTLMLAEGVDALLTKDSGGSHTVAKVDVATALGIPVVIVSRPPGEPGGQSVSTVEEAVARLANPQSFDDEDPPKALRNLPIQRSLPASDWFDDPQTT